MEEVEIGETPNNNNIKEIELIEGNIKYKCEIQKDNNYLHISIYNNIIKYKGHIHIYNIQYQLGILNYNINEIFDEIYILNNNKFNLIKDKIQIEFKILNKKRYINIELYDNIYNNNNEYIKEINELKEKIKEKDNKIKLLEEELNKYKNINKNTYDNFIISDKEPKHILKYHTDSILCSTVIKDGRFVTGSSDNSIIIYNNKTFKSDLKINEHNRDVACVIQLNSGELVSCSDDNTIKLYNIYGNEYKVIQTLNEHKSFVNKIIELKNKQLVSCSSDQSIIFYNKDNNEYKKDYSISTNEINGPIIQTKDNEICYYERYNDTIFFYDFIKRNNIKKINDISVSVYSNDSLLMISKDLLLITGKNIISIININSYNLINTIKVDNSGYIHAVCMLNKDMILTVDTHDDEIYTLSKLGNGLILSGSADKSIKIW